MSEYRELDVASILAGVGEEVPEGHRSGLVALCGRPNVGKSTLLNRLVGEKVAIVTDTPGTTRNAIRGVLTRDDAQLVFLDTPGLAKPRTLLTRRLNDLVRDTWAGVDVIVLLVDVADGVGAGDRFLAAELSSVSTPVIAVANKMDKLSGPDALLPALSSLSQLMTGDREFAEVIPLSAETGDNVEVFLEVLIEHLTEGPRLLPPDQVTDQPETKLVAELLREQLIRRTHQELPHSIAVTVDEIRPSEQREDLVEIDAVIHVERDSQKGIIIGKGGATLKGAATDARAQMEVLLGAKVFLTTHVKVAKEWQRDSRQLGRLGY